MSRQANILLVDDRAENLLALHAILEPLGQQLVTASSGEEALKHLLEREFALILLDVRMPGMDGFETASFIKGRNRTRDIPIIFLTAEVADTERVFDAYAVGAVDYLLKPFDAEILRAKTRAFIELWEKAERIREQEAELRAAEQQAAEREVEEVRQRSEERYLHLAEAMPHIVWTADERGRMEYVNEQWYHYTGLTRLETEAGGWQVALHPDEVAAVNSSWEQARAAGTPFELEYRFRSAQHNGYRWQLGRAVPMRSADGQIVGWVGTSTDIHDRKLLERTRDFFAQASTELAAILDQDDALSRVARLAVETIADWCTVDIVGDDGTLVRLATEYDDEVNTRLAGALVANDKPPLLTTSQAVLERASSVLVRSVRAELRNDRPVLAPAELEIMRGLGLDSLLSAPLVIRGQQAGVVTLLRADGSEAYSDTDLEVVHELARRLSTSMDRARLYRTAEQRARAATALATVADGVCMVNSTGVVELWNPAAERTTGIDAAAAVGSEIAQLLPGWEALERAAAGEEDMPSATTVPVEAGGRELWLAVSGAPYEEGVVYTFRDITEQRIVEKMKTDFVATVSHELRTPLAAISGAAATLRRDDIEVGDDLRETLLQIMVDQSSRLSDMVQNLLLASRLEAGAVAASEEVCDVGEVVSHVLTSARAYAPETIELRERIARDVPDVQADTGHLRQVLTNLVENAVKYSPDGGRVTLSAKRVEGAVRISVRDQGIGIPRSEHRRIFEKFYRLDANMTRGIGGSGLGLYICAELVRLMGGTIRVDAPRAGGTVFHVDLQPARTRHSTRAAGVAQVSVGSGA